MSETPWISAADELPEDGQEVLVWMNGNFDHYVYIKRPNWWMYVGRGGSVDADIWEEVQEDHYWMPLPEPPHKGNEMLYIEVRDGELVLLTEQREVATELAGREDAVFEAIIDDTLISANVELAKCFWRMMEFLKGKPNGVWWVSFDGPCRVSHWEKDHIPGKERFRVWVDCIDVTPEGA